MDAKKKKEVEILEKDTEFHVELKRAHPRGKMNIGEVTISAPGNYTLSKGTNLKSDEIVAWFNIKPAGRPAPAPKKDDKK